MITSAPIRCRSNIIPLLLFVLISTTNASNNLRKSRRRNAVEEVPPPISPANLAVVCTKTGQTLEVAVSAIPGLIQSGASLGACYDCTTCPDGYDTGCKGMKAKTCTCIVGSDGVTLTPICNERTCSRLPEANFNKGKPACLAGQQLQVVPPQPLVPTPPQGGTDNTPPPPLVQPPTPPQGGGGQTTTNTPPPPPPPVLVPPPTLELGSGTNTNTNTGGTAASCSDGVLSSSGECYNCNKCPSGYYDGCNNCSCPDPNNGGLPGGCTEKFCMQVGEPSCSEDPPATTTTTLGADSSANANAAFCSNGVVSPTTGQCYDCNTCPDGYNDGCNNCFCGDPILGLPGGCTEMACKSLGEPYCK